MTAVPAPGNNPAQHLQPNVMPRSSSGGGLMNRIKDWTAPVTGPIMGEWGQMSPKEKRNVKIAIACFIVAMLIISTAVMFLGPASLLLTLPFVAPLIGLGSIALYAYRYERQTRMDSTALSGFKPQIPEGKDPHDFNHKYEAMIQALMKYRDAKEALKLQTVSLPVIGIDDSKKALQAQVEEMKTVYTENKNEFLNLISDEKEKKKFESVLNRREDPRLGLG